MRFGDAEVDAVYERLLRPVIEEVAIPRVVNRIVHNDRIDTRIRKEVQDADIAVADLTHARPSVYYEAGYAERTVPVIYTCRSDHLSSRAPDNARVHFDLAMANCVDWRSPTDRTFRRRFRARLRYVIAPILHRFAEEEKDRAATEAFAHLSENARTEAAVAACLSEAKTAGWQAKEHPDFRLHERASWLLYGGVDATVVTRRFGYRLLMIVRSHATKRLLGEIVWWLMQPDYPARGRPTLRHVILVSMRGIPRTTIAASFRDVQADPSFPESSWIAADWPLIHSGLPSRGVRLTVIDRVTSEPRLRERLRRVLPRAVLKPLEAVSRKGTGVASVAEPRTVHQNVLKAYSKPLS